jgi:outer membrane protein assembly factor BamA
LSGAVRRYGSIIGDMASYDAFTLGGPYSVRGFSVGELAACRRFAEAAVELRVPVLGRQLFAFAERGTDLGAPAGGLPAADVHSDAR